LAGKSGVSFQQSLTYSSHPIEIEDKVELVEDDDELIGEDVELVGEDELEEDGRLLEDDGELFGEIDSDLDLILGLIDEL
jgi:hypothetical protein